MEIDNESSNSCTFQTPFGRWKFNTFPFGLSSALEIFQKYNKGTFSGIPNLQIYFDDLIIKTESETEHDEILNLAVEQARKKILNLILKNCNSKFLRLSFLV